MLLSLNKVKLILFHSSTSKYKQSNFSMWLNKAAYGVWLQNEVKGSFTFLTSLDIIKQNRSDDLNTHIWRISLVLRISFLLYKSGDSYVVVETKNNDGLHFCTTETYVPQEYFWMCYIRRQLMFCCDLVIDDDVRRWHMTSWKLEFIILPRPSFRARCPRQDLSPGLYLCWGSVLWF